MPATIPYRHAKTEYRARQLTVLLRLRRACLQQDSNQRQNTIQTEPSAAILLQAPIGPRLAAHGRFHNGLAPRPIDQT